MRRTTAVLSLVILVAGFALAASPVPTAPAIKLGPQHAATAGLVQILNRTQQNQAPQPALPKVNPTDATINCYPQALANWTGSVNSGGTRTDNSMVRGVGYENGYFCFDITGIPAGATITGVTINAYLNANYYPYWSLNRMTTGNPVTDPGSTVYVDADYNGADGYYIANYDNTLPIGWRSYDLGATGIADLTARLVNGYFAVGITDFDYYATYYVIFDGWNQANIPYITVTYTAAGVIDVGCTNIGSPNHGSDLWVGGSIPVTAVINNYSGASQDIPVTATDGGAYTQTQTVTVGAGSSAIASFAAPWSPTATGAVDFMVYTALPGDGDASNDTFHFIKNIAPVSEYTIQYDNGTMENAYYFYEAYPEYVMAEQFTPNAWPCVIDKIDVCNVVKYNPFGMQWPDASYDSFRLQIWADSDGDGFPEEPPIYVEQIKPDSFAPNDFVSAIPLAGSVLINSGDFWIGMINAQGGGAEGCGIAGQAYAGRQWTRQGINETDWLQGSLYGDHMLRAHMTAIHFQVDLGVTAIVTPVGLGVAGPYSPSAYVKNVGLDPTTATTATFDIPAATYTSTMPVPALAPNESVLVTFDPWTATPGTYPMTCTVTYAGDLNPSNDVKAGSFSVVDWYENFDVTDGLFTQISTGNQWEWGTPNYAGGPTASNSLPNCWGTNLTGPYSNNANYRLNSRQLVALVDNPTLYFYMWVSAEGYYDGMNLKYSTDGTNYTLITAVNPPYNGTAYGLSNEQVWNGQFPTWRMVTATIPVTTGQSFYVRWHFGADGSVTYPGCYVDDVAGVGLRPALLDVGVSQIVSPPVTVNPSTPYNVRIRVANTGEVSATFSVHAEIDGTAPGDTYIDQMLSQTLAPGTNFVYNMPSIWIPAGGTYQMTAWTVASGDGVPTNDTLRQTIVGGSVDIACNAITVPAGNIDTMVTIIPAASFTNNGSVSTQFEATYTIDDGTDAIIYTDVKTLTLASGATQVLPFVEWPKPHALGSYTAKCSLYVAGDQNAANNVKTKAFQVMVVTETPGWYAMRDTMPSPQVKDGGSISYGDGAIYSFKGGKTDAFFKYNIAESTWTALTNVPAGTKPLGKGSASTYGDGRVYVMKGNSTNNFYKYNTTDSTWTALKNIPLEPTQALLKGKTVKGGGSMAYVAKGDTEYVYILKGGSAGEFYRYDVAADTFKALAITPFNTKQKYDKGSWIAYDGTQFLYLMQAKYNALFKYDVMNEAWVTTPTLSGMPFIGRMAKSKKVGDGSCAAWNPDGEYIFSMKGNNTLESWKYVPATDTWTEMDTIPQAVAVGAKKKKVKAGAGVVYYPGTRVFFVQKGNKSNQFWKYVPPMAAMYSARPNRDGVATAGVTNVVSLAVSPSPMVSGYATVRYSLPKAGMVDLNIFDVTGRTVMTRTFNAGRTGATGLDLRNLSAGVYLVKLSSDGFATSQKLVVER